MTDFYKRFFTKTPKEEEIENRLDALRNEYENSESYKAYVQEEQSLYEELVQERVRKKADIGAPPKRDRGVKKVTDGNVEKKAEEYPEVDRLIEDFKKLSSREKRAFAFLYGALNSDRLDTYSNPVTTHEHLSELQDILVQVCINYINENKLTDIDEISFSADSLQHSARFGEWVPATDSFIKAVGVEEVQDGDLTYYVRRKITEVC